MAFRELRPRLLHAAPPVIEFEAFLSSAEMDELLAAIRRHGAWQRSPAGGYGAMDLRTSSTSFCVDDCDLTPIVRAVLRRAAEVSSVPQQNIENVQFLNYSAGQFFRSHTDSRGSFRHAPMGNRIFSLFIYLSDVEEGGETYFPRLDLAVTPRQGRALLFANVLDEDPDGVDERSSHEGRPVVAGYKLAANVWIYNYDYRASAGLGCSDISVSDELERLNHESMKSMEL